jgi:hypothetical protein
MAENTKAVHSGCTSHASRHSIKVCPPPPSEKFGARLSRLLLLQRLAASSRVNVGGVAGGSKAAQPAVQVIGHAAPMNVFWSCVPAHSPLSSRIAQPKLGISPHVDRATCGRESTNAAVLLSIGGVGSAVGPSTSGQDGSTVNSIPACQSRALESTLIAMRSPVAGSSDKRLSDVSPSIAIGRMCREYAWSVGNGPSTIPSAETFPCNVHVWTA